MQELSAALSELGRGRPAALVLVIGVGGSTPRATGTRMVVFEDGQVGTVGGGEVEHRVVALARASLRDGIPRRFDAHLTRDLGMCCGGEMSFHVEPFLPATELVIYGAGHVAHAFVPMAVALGFSVTVVDDRDDLNTADRFPCARITSDPVDHASSLLPSPTRHVLIVTHDHALDLDLCRVLLPQQHAWIGMIGSRAKVTKFFVRLRAAGVDPAHFERFSAPVGLALRSETPAEIAVSIAAELVQLRRDGPPDARPLAIRRLS